MATFTTTDGARTVESTLTDTQARNACERIPMNHRDRNFASSLVRAFNTQGFRISHNRRVWLHILANQQIRRETPVAVAPVVVTPAVAVPVAPFVPADVDVDTVANGLQLTMLMYDIPERADIANPSGRLRQIGLRLNKSVWLVPSGRVPHYLINELLEVGSSVITAPYDVTAAAGLLKAAIVFANRELADAAKRAEASATAALEELNGPDGDPNQKRRVYDRKIEAIGKRLEVLVSQMQVGSNVFGVSGAINYGMLRNAASSIGISTLARAAAYTEAVAELVMIGTDDATAMAETMITDCGDAMVAADMIQDQGDERSNRKAESIRATFAENPDDDNVYSLVDDQYEHENR